MDITECNERGKAFRNSIDAGKIQPMQLIPHLSRWIDAGMCTYSEAHSILDATDRFAWVVVTGDVPACVLPTSHALRKFAERKRLTVEFNALGIATLASGLFARCVPFGTLGSESGLM